MHETEIFFYRIYLIAEKSKWKIDGTVKKLTEP